MLKAPACLEPLTSGSVRNLPMLVGKPSSSPNPILHSPEREASEYYEGPCLVVTPHWRAAPKTAMSTELVACGKGRITAATGLCHALLPLL